MCWRLLISWELPWYTIYNLLQNSVYYGDELIGWGSELQFSEIGLIQKNANGFGLLKHNSAKATWGPKANHEWCLLCSLVPHFGSFQIISPPHKKTIAYQLIDKVHVFNVHFPGAKFSLVAATAKRLAAENWTHPSSYFALRWDEDKDKSTFNNNLIQITKFLLQYLLQQCQLSHGKTIWCH